MGFIVFLSGLFWKIKHVFLGWDLGFFRTTLLKDDDDTQRQVKSLYYAGNKLRGTFDQCFPVKDTVSYLLHANVCLSIMEQIHTG